MVFLGPQLWHFLHAPWPTSSETVSEEMQAVQKIGVSGNIALPQGGVSPCPTGHSGQVLHLLVVFLLFRSLYDDGGHWMKPSGNSSFSWGSFHRHHSYTHRKFKKLILLVLHYAIHHFQILGFFSVGVYAFLFGLQFKIYAHRYFCPISCFWQLLWWQEIWCMFLIKNALFKIKGILKTRLSFNDSTP